MAVSPTRHTDAFATTEQIGPADVAQIAALGYHTLINNRPDGEGGAGQPTSAEIEAAATAAGLRYAYLPVVSGQITEPEARRFAELLAEGPTRSVAGAFGVSQRTATNWVAAARRAGPLPAEAS